MTGKIYFTGVVLFLGLASAGRVQAQDSTAVRPDSSGRAVDSLHKAAVPARSVAGAAALLPGVDRQEGTDELLLRGAQPGQTAYLLDGVLVPAGLRLPWPAVAEVAVRTGHVPASFAETLSGLVAVTTAAPQQMGATVEGFSSEGLDAYGYNEAALAVGGPLAGARSRFFLSGTFLREADAAPSALALPRLRADLRTDLLANPQLVQVGGVPLRPLPGDLPHGIAYETVRQQLGLPMGEPAFVYRSPLLAADAFTVESARPHNDRTSGALYGRLDVALHESLDLLFGGHFQAVRRNHWDFFYSVFNEAPYSRSESSLGRLDGTLLYRLAPSLTLTFEGDYTDARFTTFRPGFSSDVRDLLRYGDVDDPANAVWHRYKGFRSEDGTLQPLFGDGNSPSQSNLFATPGAAASGYGKGRRQRTSLAATLLARLGPHRLEVGGEVVRQTWRSFAYFAPDRLARFFDDDFAEVGADLKVQRYEELRFGAFDAEFDYYGYDYLGLEEADDQDVEDFLRDVSFDMAPFRPSRYSGYVREQVTLGPATLDLGLRLDVFEAGMLALRYPFTLFPLVRAGELGVALPPGIDDDFAVLFDYIAGAIGGYQGPDGFYYDAQGQPLPPNAVRPGEILRRQDENGELLPPLTDGTLAMPPRRTAWQPRLNLEVAVVEGATLFGYYNELARMPYEAMPLAPHQYQLTVYQARLVSGNPALRPERSTSYGLGARFAPTPRLRGSLEAFQRQYDDLVGLRGYLNATPQFYVAPDNIHTATVRGVEAAFEGEPAPSLSLAGSYTWQQGKGTAPSEDPLRTQIDRTYALTTLPLAQDRRHQVKLRLAYQLGAGEGPVVLGTRPFERLGLGLFADLKSGRPYTTFDEPIELYLTFAPLIGAGGPHDARLPWTALLHLRLDRTFLLGRTPVTLSAWVQNLLDADNVQEVYGFSGEAGDDGLLASPRGVDSLRRLRETDGAAAAEAYEAQYRFRLNDPAHYGIPRLVRLGLRLAL